MRKQIAATGWQYVRQLFEDARRVDRQRETIAELAVAVIRARGDAPFVWCHFPYLEFEGSTTFREFADGSVLACDTATGQWMMVPYPARGAASSH